MRVAITGMGMRSPVGHNGPSTCAALRAGISRLIYRRDLVDRDGEPLAASRVPGLVEGVGLPERVGELASSALEEALTSIPKGSCERLHALLLTGETARAGDLSPVVAQVRSIITRTMPKVRLELEVYAEGHAAGVKALLSIQERLVRTPASAGLLIGADSLSNTSAVAYFEKAHRLRETQQPRGLNLGEAAACLVLRSELAVRETRAHPFAMIVGAGHAMEPVPLAHDAPLVGTGLTQSILGALESARWEGDTVRRVYTDLNGEPCRSHEWMLAMTRTLSGPEVIHPADCIGDVGAATVPLLLGMAAMALHRGYAKSPRLLVCCSSDEGLRGSICIQPVNGGREENDGTRS